MPEPLAVVARATKEYDTESGPVLALHELDAVVPAGAITAVVGVSGSGKSTLLRLLAGQELPSSGVVCVRDLDLAKLDGRALRRFRRDTVAYVSQRAADNVYPHLSLAEQGAGDRELGLLGVAGRAHARASQLSGGELARAAFAIALSRGTKLLVVDEPTAELDRETAAALLGVMRDATARGTSFLVATHDPDVLAIADNVVSLTAIAEPAAAHPTRVQTGATVLTAAGLMKSYDGATAVRDVGLELHAGELAAIVGRSGSGKSTLLMLLAGWLPPDAGTVESGHRWAELAYVPQRFGLVPELTVHDNVDLPARLARVPGHTTEVLERLALGALAERYPHQISIGQQQRVAIARALCLRPRVLLVDEPTSHQDGASAGRVWAALAAAVHDGTACLVATHEPGAVERANTAWTIGDGRLRALA